MERNAGSTAAAGSHRASGAQGKDSDRFGSRLLGVLEGEGAGLCEEPRGPGMMELRLMIDDDVLFFWVKQPLVMKRG